MTAPAPVLEARRIVRSFGGVRAVAGISLSVASGEVVALIGPNGAGKSTCFNLLNGQLRPDAGEVLLSGRSILGLPPRHIWRLGVGRTFQVAATFGSMSVVEAVQTALASDRRQLFSLHRRLGRLHRDEAAAIVDEVGMTWAADMPCGLLAYGDVKRAELALALANRPRLLLMDEPTAGMAPGERGELMELITRIAAERQVAVLFTEHDMDVVFRHAHRILVMDRGRLIAEGAPQAVRADAEVQRIYLGEEAGQ